MLGDTWSTMHGENQASMCESSLYKFMAKLLPRSSGKTLVAMTTGLKPNGATPNLNLAATVATRKSVAKPKRKPPPTDVPCKIDKDGTGIFQI